jgi:hypothetical protein
MAAIVVDRDRNVCRGVIGATHGAPHVIEDAWFLADGFDAERGLAEIEAAGLAGDPYDRQIHFAALKRAALRVNA